MVPVKLDDWTHQVIAELCSAGYPESDRHDFKGGLPDAKTVTKLCCAFANTFGGFLVLGIRETGSGKFEVLGVEPDSELYGTLVSKIRADPNITVSYPKILAIPDSSRVIYVFEVPRSPRRPHLPTAADERVFWKRQGSSCSQMTLEEIRHQMSSYEEKLEKLALLLIDLSHKLRSVSDQSQMPDGSYNGDVFSFEIVDHVVAETYSILRADIAIISALNTIRKRLQLLNAEKEKLLRILSMSYTLDFKNGEINTYRHHARLVLPELIALVRQIERSIHEKFHVENPYKDQH